MRVSAVIVHFRGGDRLRRCVESCRGSGAIDEVVIVDNEGVGPSLRRELGPDVRIIEMSRNVGYGRAANVGLAACRGEAALLLNQDVEIPKGTVRTMLDAGTEADAWIVGPRLVGSDRVEAPAKLRFPPPLRWERPRSVSSSWRYVPWVAGAAMLIMPRHTDLRFDDRLFMYAEDEELCWRVWAGGGAVILADEAPVWHEGGTATATRWGRRRIALRTVANRARFVRWHRGWAGAAAYLAAAVRESAGRLARRGRGA